MKKLSKRNILIPGALLLAVACTAVPAYADGAHSTPVETLLPEFDESQSAKDLVLAEEADLGALGGIDPASVRLLGEDELGTYWLGRAGSSEVCLVVQAPGEYEVTSSTCADIGQFSRTGLSLRTGETADADNNPEAYLMPADVSSSELEPYSASGANFVPQTAEAGIRSGLLVVRSGDADRVLEPTKISREDGSTFEFTPLDDAE
ncbi:hypothetical protein [Brachybacterium sp.]|uniref:hypothetical protein n=1 Tax=Brachybacterium sp. TaxID=1891286 RepID=UPI002ED22E90